MLNKAQIGSILAAAFLFCGLYFGFDTRPGVSKVQERSRALQAEALNIETLVNQAKTTLDESQLQEISALEKNLENEAPETATVEILKKISAFWYKNNQLPVAGAYAEEVALIENADSSWSVAGALFYTSLVQSSDPDVRTYSAQHAVKAFESAASLAPKKAEHRVNLALVYAENPPPDNPMQAVMMLRELEQKYPESASVYNALGRLAIKTGQWQRAVDRLEKAWSLEKNNPNTPCLLAKAYEGLGNNEKATEFAAICNKR